MKLTAANYLLTLLFPIVCPLITPVRGPNGEADLTSIINHVTLLEQTVEDLKGVKTQAAVLESKLQAAEREIARISSEVGDFKGVKTQVTVLETQVNRLTSELGTCQTDMASIKTRVQAVESLKDCCDGVKNSMNNLTISEANLQSQVTSMNSALADVYNKTSSNSKFLNTIHGMHDLIEIDGWVLVFRAEADNGISVYDTWMNDAIYHDNPLLPWLVGPECQSLQTSHPCRVHYKSKIVPLWQTVNVQQVKVLLIKNSQIRQQILFDGVGTTKTSWFTRDRVINSTWTDIKTAPVNYFSIKGHEILQDRSRRFFINSIYGGCSGDHNWLMVIDAVIAGGACQWDHASSIPKIIYSRKSTDSTTSNDLHDFEYGDVMAILVKLGDM